MTPARLSRRGLAAASAAFTIWGLFPVYLHPLANVPAIQVIAHRITWSCALLLAWMLLRGDLGRLSATLANPRLLARLALTAMFISINWLVYVWSVTHGHIVDASLGYYINPLMNVLLGVLVLRERMNRTQWVAIALAALAVAYLAVLAGRAPWIAFTLAVSFSMYGLVRKVISVDALPGLATETLLLLPLAVAYLAWCQVSGSGALVRAGPAVDGAAGRQRTGHRGAALSVRLRGAPAAVFDRGRAAVHRAEPAAACAACSSTARASRPPGPRALRCCGWRSRSTPPTGGGARVRRCAARCAPR